MTPRSLLTAVTISALALATVGLFALSQPVEAWSYEDCVEINFDHEDCQQYETPTPTPTATKTATPVVTVTPQATPQATATVPPEDNTLTKTLCKGGAVEQTAATAYECSGFHVTPPTTGSAGLLP